MGSKNGKPVLREEDINALVKTSGLEEAKIREFFNNFVAEHPDGKMKKNDFHTMIEKALPNMDTKKIEKHVFRIYDVDNDGCIDFTEFMMIYFILSEGTPEECLSKIFRVFDVNSDGSITQKEMRTLIKDMYHLFQQDDPNLASQHLLSQTTFAENG